jgi:SAM-dependent methyltransferase
VTTTPYYGTYHHTTAEQSEIIRSALKTAFIDVFRKIENPDSIELILDAGCGLGYLSEIAASFFDRSSVIGVDVFGSVSLPDADIEIAENNMKSANLGDRVKFIKADLNKLEFHGRKFDLVVSNLVFHNLGKKKFSAYSKIFDVMKHGSYFALGDFFSGAEDKNFLSSQLQLLNERKNIDQMPSMFSIILLRK